MIFAWDEAKNQLNQRKHGIPFEMARHVFDDPLHLSRQDRVEDGELRWQTLGKVDYSSLVLVAHTVEESKMGDVHIRIISARRATKLERRIYEQGI